MKSKILNILRWIFFIPTTILCALIISGTVSVLNNAILWLYCHIAVLPQVVNCPENYFTRTFLADLVFYIVILDFIHRFAPKHKDIFRIVMTVICLIGQLYLSFLFLYVPEVRFTESALNSHALTIGLLIYLIIQIRNMRKSHDE